MERLDKYLAEHGLSDSREKAKREILAGWVKVAGETCRDVSRKVAGDEEITVSRPKGIYVSRGGYKLERALDYFSIDVKGVTALDLGASTGGFTDCMLKRGAQKVYAVDVGYGQLDYRLRTDERVVVLERTNARHLTNELIPDEISFISADLSFISFAKVFPVIRELFPHAQGAVLIKPQFEAMKSEHKKGIVRDAKAHVAILERVLNSLKEEECVIKGLTYSPIRGPKGNIEFLLYFGSHKDEASSSIAVKEIVEEAHEKTEEKLH